MIYAAQLDAHAASIRSEGYTVVEHAIGESLRLELIAALDHLEKEAGYGLPELFEAGTTRARELATDLSGDLAEGTSTSDLQTAVDEASLVLWTLRAITERNANAKIALRDMLLQMEA